MRRWGQIAEAKSDDWYAETAKKVYRPDLYLKAAELLVAEGRARREDFPFGSDGYKPVDRGFMDGIAYDGRAPNAYLASLKIGLKGAQKVVGNAVEG